MSLRSSILLTASMILFGFVITSRLLLPEIEPNASNPQTQTSQVVTDSSGPYKIVQTEDLSLADRRRVVLRVVIQDKSASKAQIRRSLLDAARRQDAEVVVVYGYREGDDWGSEYTAGRLEWSRNGGGWASNSQLPPEGKFDAGRSAEHRSDKADIFYSREYEHSTIEHIVANSEPSVALIEGKMSKGTGFVVQPEMVLTNSHVISEEMIQDLKIAFPAAKSGRRGSMGAELLYEDKKRDLAMLSVRTEAAPLTLASSFEFKPGMEVITIGNPGIGSELTLKNAVSRGLLSTQAEINGQTFYQLDVSINSGNSGGPVIDLSGRVIGVATLKASKQEGLGFCIPVADIVQAVLFATNRTNTDLQSKSSFHNASVAFSRIKRSGDILSKCLELYVTTMESAIDSGYPASTGLNLVSRKIDPTMRAVDRALMADSRRVFLQITSDGNLDASIRKTLANLYKNYDNMKSMFDKPSGDFLSYKTNVKNMSSFHKSVVSVLNRYFEN